jgi:16S rRNA (cytidine1402-2'-O)-methyltransferase
LAVCRELTKLHEEVVRGTAHEVREAFAARDAVKGEIVLVIDAPSDEERAAHTQQLTVSAADRAAELVGSGIRPKEVARRLIEEFGLARNEAYDIALAAK